MPHCHAHVVAPAEASVLAPPTPHKAPLDHPVKASDVPSCLPANRFRYVILVLGLFCLTSVCSNMHSYNFAVICMSPAAGNASGAPPPPRRHDVPLYDFDQSEKTYLMWAVAVGSMLATFPFNFLYARFGARYVFFGAGIASSAATLIIPAAAGWGFGYFLGARLVQGIAYAADFAAMGIVIAQWASLKQQAIFVGLLTCFTPLSTVITNPVSGILCDSRFGWPAIFYVHGAAGLVFFVLWVVLFRDDPSTHPYVTGVELEKIHRDKTVAHIQMDSFVPYTAILKDSFVWVIWLNALADLCSGLFVLQYAPTYIRAVLGFSVNKTGFLGAMPGLFHIPVKMACATVSDFLSRPSERAKLRIFNSLALCIPAALYAGLGYLPAAHPALGVLFVVLINSSIGANCGGFYKAGTLVSRQYSAFVISNIQFIKCLTLFICPGLVAFFVEDDADQSQWRHIFIIFTIFLVIANLIFCYHATAKPRPFTFITRETVQKSKIPSRTPSVSSTQKKSASTGV